MPSTAHEEHLSEHGTWIGVHEWSRVKVSLLRSTAQWCWVITGTVGDEARPILHADDVPRAVEVACQGARVPILSLDQGSTTKCVICRSGAGWADFKAGRPVERTIQELGCGLAVVVQVGNEGGALLEEHGW